MASRFQPPRSIPPLAGLTAEQQASFQAWLQQTLTAIGDDLNALGRRDVELVIAQERVDVPAGSVRRISPSTGGAVAVLPTPSAENAGDTCTIFLESPVGALKVVASPGKGSDGKVFQPLINGAAQATFSNDGVIRLTSNGVSEWKTSVEAPNESPASVTNVTLSGPGTGTGLSVLGVAGASAATRADIQATKAFQALRSNTSGNGVGWENAESTTYYVTVTGTLTNYTLPTGFKCGDMLMLQVTGNVTLNSIEPPLGTDRDFWFIMCMVYQNGGDFYVDIPNIGTSSGNGRPFRTPGQLYPASTAYTYRMQSEEEAILCHYSPETVETWRIVAGTAAQAVTGAVEIAAGKGGTRTATLGTSVDLNAVLTNDNATDGVDIEVSQSNQVLFDEAGDGAYTSLTGQILGNAGLRIMVDAADDSNVQSFVAMGQGSFSTGIVVDSEGEVTVNGDNGLFLNGSANSGIDLENGNVDLDAGGAAGDDVNANAPAGDVNLTAGVDVNVIATGDVDIDATTNAEIDGNSGVAINSSGGNVALTAASGVISLSATTADLTQNTELRFDIAGDGDYSGLTGNLQANGNFVLEADGIVSLAPSSDEVVHLPRGFLRFIEQSASTPSLTAGQGMFWVRDDSPNVPMFTDDGDTDYHVAHKLTRRSVNSAGGTQADLDVSAIDLLVVSATATFNGFAGGHDGKELVINAGASATVTIPHNGGSAGNRPFNPGSGNLVIAAFESATYLYDGDSSAWRLKGTGR